MNYLEEYMRREESNFKAWCEEHNVAYDTENTNIRKHAKSLYEEWKNVLFKEQKERERQAEERLRKTEIKERVTALEKITPTVYKDSELTDFSEALQSKIKALLEGKSALILGDNGVGKSHLAWALARTLTREGKKVKYVKAQLLLYEIKSKSDPYQYCIREYGRSIDCVIIDEIDKIFESKADFIYLNYLIDYRWEWSKQIIVLGNGNKNQFIESLGQSIYSRLRGNGMDIMLTGADRRLSER